MSDWDLGTPPQKKAGPQPPASAGAARYGAAPGSASPAPEARTEGGPGPVTKPKRLKIQSLLVWIAAGVACLLVGMLVGFFIARSQTAHESVELAEAQQRLGAVEKALSLAEERNWNYYRANDALEAELEQARSNGTTPTTAPGSGFAKTYGDGVYLVGEDIFPGTYDGVVVDEAGYWARLKGTDGLVASIITNALPRGPFVLTIVESDKAVELQGVEITVR
jgi:hypothetical protein